MTGKLIARLFHSVIPIVLLVFLLALAIPSVVPADTAWRSMIGGAAIHLNDICGGSSSDVLAVGSGGVTLHYDEAAINYIPSQPSNVSPANGATGVSMTPALRSSDFSDPDAGDTHAASQWQIRTSAGSYSSPVFDSGTDTSDLTSIAISSGILGDSATYCWHVRYQDDHGDWSRWSAETSLTTINRPPNQPINVSPSEGATGVSLTPTLQSSAFSDPDAGDIHAYSQWRVRASSGSYSSPVRSDYGTGTYLIMPFGYLCDGITYYWQVRYQDNHLDWSGWSAETSFTTAGCAWGEMSSGTGNRLRGVWGSSSTDVFAVGTSGTILHYDGSAWSAMNSRTSDTLWDVWGSSATDVFAVGEPGTILHYDGNTWSAMSSGLIGGLYGVWGSSATDVFAVGHSVGEEGGWGAILHYDGSAWSAMNSGTGDLLSDVWGSSATDVFAVGALGQVRHYDGSTWSGAGSFGGLRDLEGVWGSSATDVFAVGDAGIGHYDGSTGSVVSSESCYGVWGSSSRDVFAVGHSGIIMHYDSSAWGGMSSGTTDALYGVWGSSATDVFVVGDAGIILHYPVISGNQPPGQPSNVLPANGAIGISLMPSLQSSAFSDPDAGDIHVASQWQATTTTGNYSTPVYDGGVDASNMTAIAIPSGILTYSTTYYWHVRYQDNHGDWSEWSVENSFSTASRYPRWDVNQDGKVDYKDLAMLGGYYGTAAGDPGFNPYADINQDGKVDYKDLAILGAHYGEVY
jgi:hypothetical protein